MEKKAHPAVGWLLIAFVAVVVALGPMFMIATRGWGYTVLYILVLALFLGTMMLGIVAFVRFGRWLGEWPFFILATLAIPGSFGLIGLLRRWELNDTWWSGLVAIALVGAATASWFDAAQRLGADAPPNTWDGLVMYRVALGWRILAWVCGIGFAGMPLAAWLQDGGAWIGFAMAGVVVGSMYVTCVHRKRVVLDADMLRVRTCLHGWRSQPLANLRRIVPPAERDRRTGTWTLRFAGGGELPIPAALAGRERLLVELRRHLPEDDVNA